MKNYPRAWYRLCGMALRAWMRRFHNVAIDYPCDRIGDQMVGSMFLHVRGSVKTRASKVLTYFTNDPF